ncbi:MAG: thiol protease/hemagglutinin PrtT [Bacteroidales bacterium]|nr:thiol protease/hemagglutinin PrtT [Bacteroidales bacterium]
MKRLILLQIIFFFCFSIFAAHVSEKIAMKAAQKHYSIMFEKNMQQAAGEIVLSPVYAYSLSVNNELERVDANGSPLLYIFNVNQDDGFVIISADDGANPILGYSLKGSYSGENVPPGLLGLLQQYAREISFLVNESDEKSMSVDNSWSELLKENKSFQFKSFTAVDQLVSTQWNQSPYVNDMCPYDYTYNELTVTGCPATAMAQIMKFWNYPETGISYHSYNHPTYGTLSANFEATTYEYGSMPNQVNSVNNAVATLMYHCGVAVDMQYGVAATGGSGGYVIEAHSPVTHCCEYAFKTYFGYKTTIQGLFKDDFNDVTWVTMLKNDLDEGRPIQYAGFGQGGGHTWVCDGYDNNNYFHMNWGWGGIYDGYFTLSNLSPGSGGAGGGSGSFSSGQQALIGIEPSTGGGGGPQFDLRAYSEIVIDPNPIDFAYPIDVYVDIGNFDNSNFSGSLAAVLFNSEGDYVDMIQELTNINLASNYYDSYTFHTDELLATPGAYFIGIYYQPSGGDWAIIGAGDYNNYTSVNIVGPDNTMQMYSDIYVNPVTIVSNESFEVTFDIANYGTSNFSGEVSSDLYDSEGNYLEELAITTIDLSSGYYIEDLTFNCPAVNVEAGSYILAIWDLPSGGDWTLVGSDDYSNPITIQIAAPQVQPDIYETNDLEEQAYNLPFNMSGTQLTIETDGSNIHFGDDMDFYKIQVPAGGQYVFSARAHDSYNSGNGQTYTDDVLWAYKAGSDWSEAFDDVMNDDFVVNGGQTVYFVVSNYYQGQTGSYLLEISIGFLGLNEINDPELLNVYPNPASDIVYLNSQDWNKYELPLSVEIISITGQNVYRIENLHPESSNITIDLPDLKAGVYNIRISGKNAYSDRKLIIE